MKNKVVVYGLGAEYNRLIDFLMHEYNIVGVCDRDSKKKEGINYKFYNIDELAAVFCDFIFITSLKYYDEIKYDLIHSYNLCEEKIINIEDILGDFKNANARDKWVINKLSNIPNGSIILDAGAGESKYKKYCSHLKYIAQDFGKYIPGEMGAGLQSSKWDYSGINIKCDITDIPMESKSVDVILCTEVFEHLKNPILAVKEFSRLITRGGYYFSQLHSAV